MYPCGPSRKLRVRVRPYAVFWRQVYRYFYLVRFKCESNEHVMLNQPKPLCKSGSLAFPSTWIKSILSIPNIRESNQFLFRSRHPLITRITPKRQILRYPLKNILHMGVCEKGEGIHIQLRTYRKTMVPKHNGFFSLGERVTSTITISALALSE